MTTPDTGRDALHEHLRLLARYNVWATRRLLDAVDAVPDADYRRDLGLFFRSMHGTLNHLLVAEHRLWSARFTDGTTPALRLDEELERDRVRLRQRLIEGAEAWLPRIAGWSPERLGGRIEYLRLAGGTVSLPFAATLAHVFNHGTHHRGQISGALTALGSPAPELDLVQMLQAEAAGAA
ncbi:DinB family protein [Rubrivivax gelatinosus]|uniref:Damage-inducible protein DinB n=2 Tax=Rubrivivax gelatinosus TaxID=28068 RepID=A0ABS1DQW0_RUBGE|nr:DinB family protein [Rubrivivax gelatinosus]MBK1711784.1 damage-inducible protein DinB [Rubrivivax gelatinosus]